MRERKALTLEQAIHKMTALPASRVRLSDRGRLAAGAAADVAVFDASSIADTASYEQPFSWFKHRHRERRTGPPRGPAHRCPKGSFGNVTGAD